MKLHKFINIFLIFSGIFLVLDAQAINYDGANPLRNIYASWWIAVWSAENYYDGRDSVFAYMWIDTNSPHIEHSMVCEHTETIETSGNYVLYYQIPGMMQLYLSGWENIIMTLYNSDWEVYSSWVIVESLGSGFTPAGNHPTDTVVCFLNEIVIVPTWLDAGTYLRTQQTFIYAWEDLFFAESSYTGSTWYKDEQYWLHMSTVAWISPQYFGSWRIWFNLGYYWFDWSNPYYSVKDTSDQRYWLVSNYLGWFNTPNQWVEESLVSYYGITKFNDLTSGSWWTGTTVDYYADCTNIVTDIWCYVKGSYNAIVWFFRSFVPSIAWSGSMEWCVGSGVVTQSGILAPLSDLISLLNPFPPPEWTIVCTLLWPSTIRYHVLVPEHNFWEVYWGNQVPEQLKTNMFVWFDQTILDVLIIFVFTVLTFTSLHKKND